VRLRNEGMYLLSRLNRYEFGNTVRNIYALYIDIIFGLLLYRPVRRSITIITRACLLGVILWTGWKADLMDTRSVIRPVEWEKGRVGLKPRHEGRYSRKFN
jgi:hypothetical protein